MDIDDMKILAVAYKKNKKRGFNLLYTKFSKHIFTICYRYTNSKEDSLDLVQETFIKIYKSLDTFDWKRDIKPWINKITVNTCLNHIRNKKKLGQYCDLVNEQDILANKLYANDIAEEKVFYDDTKKIIEEEISQMPEMIKMIFILRHFNKMSYGEIAELVSIPLGTVKTNLYKGRRMLKEALLNRNIWEV